MLGYNRDRLHNIHFDQRLTLFILKTDNNRLQET